MDNAQQAFENTLKKTTGYAQKVDVAQNQLDRNRTPYRHKATDKQTETLSDSSEFSARSSTVSNLTLSLASQGYYTDNCIVEQDGNVSDTSTIASYQPSVIDQLVLGGTHVHTKTKDGPVNYSQIPVLSDIRRHRNKTVRKSMNEFRPKSPIPEHPFNQTNITSSSKNYGWVKPIEYRQNRTEPAQFKILHLHRQSNGQKNSQPLSIRSEKTRQVIPQASKGSPSKSENNILVKSARQSIEHKGMSSARLYRERNRLISQHLSNEKHQVSRERFPSLNGYLSHEIIKDRTKTKPSRQLSNIKSKNSTLLRDKQLTRQNLPGLDVLRTLPLKSELDQYQQNNVQRHNLDQSFTKYVKPSVGGVDNVFRSGGPINRPKK